MPANNNEDETDRKAIQQGAEFVSKQIQRNEIDPKAIQQGAEFISKIIQRNLAENKAKQRAVEFVSKQIQRMDGCPVCHGNKWNVSESTYTMSETNPRGLTGNVLPVVSATCKTCGYMLFFNAIEAGTTEDWHFGEKGSNA